MWLCGLGQIHCLVCHAAALCQKALLALSPLCAPPPKLEVQALFKQTVFCCSLQLFERALRCNFGGQLTLFGEGNIRWDRQTMADTTILLRERVVCISKVSPQCCSCGQRRATVVEGKTCYKNFLSLPSTFPPTSPNSIFHILADAWLFWVQLLSNKAEIQPSLSRNWLISRKIIEIGSRRTIITNHIPLQ